jgi:hypothetical protein
MISYVTTKSEVNKYYSTVWMDKKPVYILLISQIEESSESDIE